jgi:uncharacterized protein (DUF305 family)
MNTMTLRRALLPGAALLALALATGCGSDDGDGGDTGAPPATPPASSAAAGEFNDADVTFAQNMIVHHEQALEMAAMADQIQDPELAELAAGLEAAQAPEVTTMTDLLTEWGEPTEPAGGHENMTMPGMMSEEDMAELEEMSGAQFDRMFAQMLISHHGGAVQMAADVQQQGVNPDLNTLAATIEQEQSAEVETLEGIVDRL